MRVVDTLRLGQLEYMDEDLIYFDHGIPGFKDDTRYILVEDESSPFMYLQSVDHGELSFIVVSPFDFYEHYEFTLPEHVQKELGLSTKERVRIVNIVKVRDELESATINLGAPIIINMATRKGIQYILPESRYSIQQALFGQLMEFGGGR